MKIRRIVSMLILLAVLSLSLVSCASGGKPVMTFGDSTVSSNMFSYMMSSQKQYMKEQFDEYVAYYYYYTQQMPEFVDFDEYLKSEIVDEDGNTVKVSDETNEMIIESCKAFLVIKELCRRNGVKLNDAKLSDMIDEYIADQITTAGSEEYLNITLARYGASVDVMREYLYGNCLQDSLYEYLYGENGTQKISDDAVKEYFNNNFTKIDAAYYSFYTADESGKTIPVTDPSVTEEAKAAYRDANYASVKYALLYLIDVNNGNAVSDEDKTAKKAKADEALAKLKNGEITFDDAVKTYSEDTGSTGIIKKGSVDSRLANLEKEALAMEIGSYSLVETEIGYYVVTRTGIGDAEYKTIESDIVASLSQQSIIAAANSFAEDVKAGKITFDSAEENSSLCKLSKNVVFTAGELDEGLEAEIAKAENGGIITYVTSDAVFVVKKVALADDDYTKRYDDCYEAVGTEAFTNYIKSFYPEIVVDEKELAKYDFLTCEMIEILAMDPVSGEDQ